MAESSKYGRGQRRHTYADVVGQHMVEAIAQTSIK
jgi:hypothetical protein